MPEVVIVTGAGRGIGAATACAAELRGYAVCVNYLRDEGAAQSIVGQIASDGGRAVAVRGDVAVQDDVGRLFDQAERDLGPVTALVSNAGTTARITRFAKLALATLRRSSTST